MAGVAFPPFKSDKNQTIKMTKPPPVLELTTAFSVWWKCRSPYAQS